MRLAQGEALGEFLEQARVVGLGVLDHRCVRLKHDVDGRDCVRLISRRRLSSSEQQGQRADGQCGQDLQVSIHVSLHLVVVVGPPFGCVLRFSHSR